MSGYDLAPFILSKVGFLLVTALGNVNVPETLMVEILV